MCHEDFKLKSEYQFHLKMHKTVGFVDLENNKNDIFYNLKKGNIEKYLQKSLNYCIVQEINFGIFIPFSFLFSSSFFPIFSSSFPLSSLSTSIDIDDDFDDSFSFFGNSSLYTNTKEFLLILSFFSYIFNIFIFFILLKFCL